MVQDQIAPAPPRTLVPSQGTRSDSDEREDFCVLLTLCANARFEQHRRVSWVHWFLVVRQIGTMQRLQLWNDCGHRLLHPCTSNAPVQARWANARRAGPVSPNPPTVACNRWLGGRIS